MNYLLQKKVDFDKIISGNKIGQGGFASVFLAKYDGEEYVAKVGEDATDLLFLVKINHYRIVRFFWWTADIKKGKIIMLMERMKFSLHDCLYGLGNAKKKNLIFHKNYILQEILLLQ